MGIESVSLQTKLSLLLFLFLLPAIAAYSWYVYRVTVPAIARSKRIVLWLLRAAAVMLALFIAAEPVMTFTKKIVLKPVHLIFIDNSKSMSIETNGWQKAAIANKFLSELKSRQGNAEYHVYSFGGPSKKIDQPLSAAISFNEPVTNFNYAFNEIRKSETDISSVTFISDGIVTEGDDPSNAVEKPGVPVFCIALGDTNQRQDVILQDIQFNENIVAGVQTPLRVNVMSHRISDVQAKINLFEDNNQLEERVISLRAGLNQCVLNYLPRNQGEKKILVQIDPVIGESNKENNRKAVFIRVLDSKVKVLLIAGTPSTDFSFIKEALKADTNLLVREIVEIGMNKTLATYSEKLLDSASVYFMINYPSNQSSGFIFQQVAARIRDNHKPFFMLIDENASFTMLNQLADQMPVRLRSSIPGSYAVQPVLTTAAIKHPIIQVPGADVMQSWGNLPPVLRLNCDAVTKPEAENLMTIKSGNTQLAMPLMAVRGIGKQRSAVILAREIWRWQLTARENNGVLPSFIKNCFRWLNAGGERERLNVYLPKKIFAAGEKVDFTAELFDESYNLLSNEDVQLNISNGSYKREISMTPMANGVYQSSLETDKPGDYSYTAVFKESTNKTLIKSGRFLVGGQEAELRNLTTDIGLLRFMALTTQGKLYFGNDFSGYFGEINKINSRKPVEKTITGEISIWSNLWVLGLVILIFSIEWFIRKRAGML